MVALIGFIFFSVTLWWRPRWIFASWVPDYFRERLMMPTNSPDYQAVYYARFALTMFIVALVALWILGGMRGLRRLISDSRLYFLLSLGALVIWAQFSVGWASQNEQVASSHAMQWLLTLGFVIVLLAVSPPQRWIIGALVAGMLFQGTLGIVQVAHQGSINLAKIDQEWLHLGLGLSEFPLDPSVSGVSVVQSAGVRYLRAYGLTPHPNLLAGGLTMGLVASLALWLNPAGRRWTAGITAFGLWALLVTFSRASLGGFAVGIAVTLGLWWVTGQIGRKNWQFVAALVLTLGLTGGLFYLGFSDLIAARVGVADEGFDASVEARSLSDRRIYLEQARTIIKSHTWQGIGIGNFPWESHVMLRNDPRNLDLQGDNVHNFYYLVVSEVGVIGGMLTAIPFLISGSVVWRHARDKTLSVGTASLWGGVCAWLAIGWFEGYMWTLFTHQVLLWGVLAAILIPLSPNSTYNAHKSSSSESGIMGFGVAKKLKNSE